MSSAARSSESTSSLARAAMGSAEHFEHAAALADVAMARPGTPLRRGRSPCWKSAAEYGSASTYASSLSLRAHSRAVA